jgi:hypothetical protein
MLLNLVIRVSARVNIVTNTKICALPARFYVYSPLYRAARDVAVPARRMIQKSTLLYFLIM